ncbi:hypothetical protein JL722_1125 [Aureococcus anophagefferens]|nr:hypothetical protein JL722_1125 [Aureococcus anophagefferens]
MDRGLLRLFIAALCVASSSPADVVGCAAGDRAYCAAKPRFPYPATQAELDATLVVRGAGWGSIAARLAPDHASPPVRVVVIGGSMTCHANVRHDDGWPFVLGGALWPDALDTRATKLWVSDTSEGDWDHHPGRDAHRVVADSIFNAFQRLVDDADGAPRRRQAERDAAGARGPDAVGFCQHMTATISADVECAKSGYAPWAGTATGRADEAPGWIWDGERGGATAAAALAPKRRAPPKRPAKRAPPKKRPPPRARGRGGPPGRRARSSSLRRDRRVGVEFLKSYDRMGAVELTIASHDGMHSSKKSGVLYRSDAQREKIIRGADEDAVTAKTSAPTLSATCFSSWASVSVFRKPVKSTATVAPPVGARRGASR